MSDSISVAFFGYGYWGKNVLRTLMSEPRAVVKWACDISSEPLKQIKTDYPSLPVTKDFSSAMSDPEVQAVVLATPAETHVPLAKQALELGKHVFVEKPMGTSIKEVYELAEIVRQRDRIFQVGHIFEYAEPVRKLREWIQSDRLGKIMYITGNRASLGPRLRTDCNIVWDYAIHDLYMLMFLLSAEPERVAARGLYNFYPGVEDTVFIDLYFPDGTWAILHSSWAAPTKRRDITMVGDKAMVVYDETREDKLVLYECGYAPHKGFDNWGNRNWRLYNKGAEVADFQSAQPLATELACFLACVAEDKRPISDVEDGVRTIRVLDAINQSLSNQGREVSLK